MRHHQRDETKDERDRCHHYGTESHLCAGYGGRPDVVAFLALFLFGLYVSVNVSRGAWADIVGFHGNATIMSSLAWAGLGVLAVLGGHLWNLDERTQR